MIRKEQAPRSSLLRNWGEGHIYPYWSKMAKVELERLSESPRWVLKRYGKRAKRLTGSPFLVIVYRPIGGQGTASPTFRTVSPGTWVNKGKKKEPGQASTGPHGALEVAELARLEPVEHQLEGLGANSGTPSEGMVHGG